MFDFFKKHPIKKQIEENAKSQIQRTIEHLQKYGVITSLDAINRYGNTRLSGTMWALKQKGYNFKTRRIAVENRYGKKTYVTEYYINKEEVL